MKLRKLGLSFFFAGALLGIGSGAYAQAWTSLSTYEGVTHTPRSDLATVGSSIQQYLLIPTTTSYTGSTGAFPESFRIKVLQGNVVDDSLVSASNRIDRTLEKGVVRSSASSSCDSVFGISCAGAATNSTSKDASGPAVANQVFATSAPASFSSSPIGARQADGINGAPGSGKTSITLIPEPKIYAMMLAGLGLMGFVAQRRQQGATA